MLTYPENYDVTLNVPFIDRNGNTVTPVSISANLYDETDALIANLGAITFDPAQPSVNITIPAASNVLQAGVIRAGRILRVAIVTAAGTLNTSTSYIVESDTTLVFMKNTWLSLEAAEIRALDHVDFLGWAGASDSERKTALVNAFNRITMLPMKFLNPASVQNNVDPAVLAIDTPWDIIAEWYRSTQNYTFIDGGGWTDLTADTFNTTFPVEFQTALRNAQIIEANYILTSNPYLVKSLQGVESEKVGESSVTLRRVLVDYGIGPQTLRALAGFLNSKIKIARV